MKNLVFTLILGSSFGFLPNTFASECTQQEAQYIGKVKNLYAYEDLYAQTGFCSFSIDFSYFNSSKLCMLDENEVVNQSITFDLRNETCPAYYEGQEISGIIFKRNNEISIER